MRTSFPVDAPPAAWAALADPVALAAAVPGCRSVTGAGDGDGSLQVVADVSVASVRGLWSGTVVRVDADAVRVAGSGAPGTVDLVVRADPARTTLTVEGTVDGPLATVGSAVLAAALRRLGESVLAGAANPPATRGDGFRSGQGEAIGTGSGTHDLGHRLAEPMTSGLPGPPADRADPGDRADPAGMPDRAGMAGPGDSTGASRRRRRVRSRGAAAVGVVVVVVLGRRRRHRRRVG